jgi:type II secretory ATPase GspE/PulE/Tfp pilus assembly ATPase PilB-like protein
MMDDNTTTSAPPGERRFFSDQLMMDLCSVLVGKKLVTRAQIDQLNSRRTLTGESIDKMLAKESLVRDVDILQELSKLTNIPFHHIADFDIKKESIVKVQPRIAIRYNIVPVKLSGGTITLATCEVPAIATVDSLRMLLNMAIDWVLCTETDITKSIKHFYGLGAETIDNIVEETGAKVDVQSTDVSVESADAGIVRFVNQIIGEAIRMEATDIHIEPFENKLRVRYRIDGILQDVPIPKGAPQLKKAIASCLKIMADLNIAEKRKPHDGRISVRSGGDDFDLRVSILPSSHGETACLRILNRKTMFIDIEHLGLTGAQLPLLNYLSDLPHGVILLTGPTGSGKTTTLYAVLSRINKNDVKIITVEDPIEYQMEGISQIQVHSQIGLTFANILRSILRHDPDIILIGEIRDMETADIAVRASLTGHLVFSTLHTNDAPSAITRLTDMGVEPYLISSCLEGAIAQRLVRRICAACREEMTPDETILAEIASAYPDRIKGAKFYKGRGCPDCNFTSYRGRLAIFEIMVLNDAIRGMIVHQRPSNEIKHKAIENGLVTLRKDGWRAVLDGNTSIDEVVRVAKKTELAPAQTE